MRLVAIVQGCCILLEVPHAFAGVNRLFDVIQKLLRSTGMPDTGLKLRLIR